MPRRRSDRSSAHSRSDTSDSSTGRIPNPGEPRPALVPAPTDGGLVFVDVDDTIIEVHGHQKQGAGFGYSGVRGIYALLATVSTQTTAPVIVAQRLRKGASGSPWGAARIAADALKTVTRLPGATIAPVLLRADSAYYGFQTVNAALRAGADVSITARQDSAVKRAISTIPEDAWTARTDDHAGGGGDRASSVSWMSGLGARRWLAV